MNLSETDKELIAEIVEQKLRHYKLIGEPAVGLNEVYGPTLQSDLVENIPQLIKQPAVDVVEPEYVRCVKTILPFEEGCVYELSQIGRYDIEKFVKHNGKQIYSYENYRMWFLPATKAEYLAQQGEQPNQIKEEVKEKWKPSYGCKYWYIGINDGQFFISDFHWGNDDVDFINHDNNNCFKTQEEAERAAQAIQETLKNL